jgi:membrane fusion protein (multidrug efflux system)
VKTLGTLATLILATIVGYIYFNSENIQQTNTSSQVLKVEAIELKKIKIYDEIEALGTAYSNEAVNITTNTTDKIVEIRFTDGQEVKQGDVIALLNQEEEQAQKKTEQVQLAEHKRELKRLEDLLKKRATAETAHDERKTLVAISESKLKEIQSRIDDKTIRAPFDGVLGLRKISVGSLVEPGDIITTLDDISQIKLDFSIPSTYLDVVHKGAVIHAKSDALSDIFEGEVTTVASRVDSRTRSVEVRAILQNPKGIIKPGILLSIKLLRNERLAFVIPEEALIQMQDKHFVFKIEDNQVKKQEINKGKRASGWVEILDGLEIGDKIITRGQIRVRPGDKVEVETKSYSLSGVQS